MSRGTGYGVRGTGTGYGAPVTGSGHGRRSKFVPVAVRDIARHIGAGALRGAIVGLPILGIGGRIMMRIIAHWEGRAPVLTSGTLTVLLMGTIAGAVGGVLHALSVQFVRSRLIRLALFEIVVVLFTLYAVHDLLIRPMLLFVAIMVVYGIVLEAITPTPLRVAT